MLRIAVYYESRLGRNDGNPLYVWNALKRMQRQGLLEVDHLAPTGDLALHGQYDYHFWVDWGEDALTEILPYKPIFPPGKPLVYWGSDTHLGPDHRFKCADQADYAFFAQKQAVTDFKEKYGKEAVWLPHAFEPEAYPKYDLLTKKYDVCFVGHVSSANRMEALDKVFKAVPNFFYGQRRFEEASRKYAESKCVFNIAMKDDVNMRCFEVMGSGNLLVTDRIPTIEELFEDGKHCVMYSTIEEAIEKIKYYSDPAHEEERNRIAEDGYKEVMAKHTIRHRVEKMLDVIGAFQPVTA